MLVTVPLIFLPIGNLVPISLHGSLELLHAERDAVRFLVDADDLHLDRLADVEDLGRMVDAAPCHVGDMQQAVDAAEVDERTVVGDVLDHAFDNLTLFEVLHDFRTLFGAAFLKNGAARHDDVAAAAIHLQDLEGLRVVHQRGDVADRADIDLAARQEGHGAVEIDGKAALDLVEDHAFDALALVELLFELDPALFAAGFVARQHGFAQRVLDALDIYLDRVADLELTVLGLGAEFFQRHAAFDLEADIDDGHVFFDGRDGAANDLAFTRIAVRKRLVEKAGKIVAGWICCRHCFSWKASAFRAVGWRRGFALRLACLHSGPKGPCAAFAAVPAHGECWQAGSLPDMGIPARSGNRKSWEQPAQALLLLVSTSSMIDLAARNAVSIAISEVSSKCASAAGFSGESARPMSRASRCTMSARISAKSAQPPRDSMSRSRRPARTSALAVT